MKLQKGEQIVKVYHHHKFFFVWRALKIWIASLPFFVLTYIFSYIAPSWLDWAMVCSVIVLFIIVNIYDLLMYYLDTLVISNQRVVHLDWINLFKYNENQADLSDIQDIGSSENGFLSRFKMLDFGSLKIETASTKTILMFEQAPDPEEIKYFVTNLSRMHLRIAGRRPLETPRTNLLSNQEKIEITNSKVATLD